MWPFKKKTEPVVELPPSIFDDEGNVKFPCPECGGPVYWEFTCHTYGQGDKWYSCIPCDSATELLCSQELNANCFWGYTWGLNPKNPRSEANERNRPSWLVGRGPHEWL